MDAPAADTSSSATIAPLAVVDIGSNSVRLVVYEGGKRSPAALFNEKALCGLGRSLAQTGRLSEDAVQSTLVALRRFRTIADRFACPVVHAFATAAARDAENGADFIARAEAALGTSIAVLTGSQEAELAAAGIVSGFYQADGFSGDLGGGSLELIEISQGSYADGVTLPLGGLRLIGETRGNLTDAGEVIDRHLATIGWLDRGRGRPFYAVGGTWRAFARLHMAETRYPLRVVHGYRVKREDALKFAYLMDHLPAMALDGMDELSRERRETVPYGAVLLERIVKRLQPSEVIFSASGVREGLLYTLLSEAERARDPLLAACHDLAAQRSRSVAHAYELIHWTDDLITKSALDETAGERRLRHAACLLSDIKWRAHPEYRAELAQSIIAHGTFTGIDHPGRMFLALSVYFRHAGPSDAALDPRLIDMLDKRTQKRARLIGAAIRAAHMISVGMPGALPETKLQIKDKRITLVVPDSLMTLDGDRLQRRFRVLAGLLDSEFKLKSARSWL